MTRSLATLALACLLSVPLAAAALERYGYRVLDKRPLPSGTFVQGLEFDGDSLLVGTGRYGQSRLLRYAFPSMVLQQGRRLPPGLFGEGITRFGDEVFQLTWRAGVGIRYRADDLAPIASFPLPGEGWGMTHDDSALIYSDGSARLHFLDPVTLKARRHLPVTRKGSPQPRLNELEWIDGRVWANVWTSDRLVIIDPQSGAIEAEVDLAGLLPETERRPDTDVLNGIARHPETGAIWVTGKNWPWLYHIELVPAGAGQ